MKPTALIDGDIVAYQVAAVCQKAEHFDGTGEQVFDEGEVREGIAQTLQKWTETADCGDRVVLITGYLNFRKAVDPTYKSSRKDKAKPVALKFAKRLLVEEHGALMVEGLEADDLIGLMLTGSMSGGRGVAVTIDKDLRTVPGLHCNPLKGGVMSVGEYAADTTWMTQVLTGDPTDGYGGAPGIGPAKAAKALGAIRTSAEALWPRVVATYKRVGATAEDALRTARLARILRTGDYDKDKKEVILWHPTSQSRPTLPLASLVSPQTSNHDPSTEKSSSSATSCPNETSSG